MTTFAAVDIGANSVRLKVARLRGRRLVVLADDREVTRLGESVFRSGLLDPKAMAHTIEVLRRFRKTIKKHGATTVRVVATSSLRDAQNGNAFIQWVKSSTGLRVEVITGVEEGRLIHLGVIANTRLSANRILLIDLGGGSCELTLSVDQQIRDIVSLPLGAVRLTKEFLHHDPPKNNELEQMRAFIAEEVSRVDRRMRGSGAQVTIATSGTAAALAESAHRSTQSFTVPRAAVVKLAEKLSRSDLQERKALPGIGPRRAEIIVAGAAVYAELLTRLGLNGYRYLPLGLRDGVLAQMLSDYDHATRAGRQVEIERENSLIELGRRYGIDKKFANRARGTALLLFQKLKKVHGLPPEYEKLIGAAAMLLEIGSYINRTGRHRHAHYLVAHSEIFGFNTRERAIVAAITRYMGRSLPRVEHRIIRILPELDRYHVARAIAILRLALALDQSRAGVVKSLGIRVGAAKVQLTLKARRGTGELEVWAVEKEAAYFRTVFGKDLGVSLA